MAHKLGFHSVKNAIKTSGAADLSEGLNGKAFALDEIARYGIGGKPVVMAFDPIQSLLAISTDKSEIHVYGNRQVEVVFKLETSAIINHLRFVKGVYLVAVDTSSNIFVLALDTKQLLFTYTAPGQISSIETDPSLDWLLLGMQNGQILVFDIDRGVMCPLRIRNLQKDVLPKERMSPVLSISWHPRDAGTILIAYNKVAIIYSLAMGDISNVFQYEVPASATGGEFSTGKIDTARFPSLVSACWHPEGHHVLTAHHDGSLVFWDAKEAVLLQARTVYNSNVNDPASAVNTSPSRRTGPTGAIVKVSWICESNTANTSLLVLGQDPFLEGATSLNMLYFGGTPSIMITAYEKMGQHYANPKYQKIFPTPQNKAAIDFLTIPSASPYIGGNHDPLNVLALTGSGEILPFSYPGGTPFSRISKLPQSMSWISPETTTVSSTSIERNKWLGLLASSPKVASLLKGGTPSKRHVRTYETRSALCTGHADGSVRLWDTSSGEIDDYSVLELHLSNILGRIDDISVNNISFATGNLELAVSSEAGEVVLFKFGTNKYYTTSNELANQMHSLTLGDDDNENLLIDIQFRAPPKLKNGFLPISLIKSPNNVPVSSLNHSDIGFVAIGYENGDLAIIDRRVPGIIFKENLSTIISKASSAKSFRLSRNSFHGDSKVLKLSYATKLEFAIMGVDDDTYSSILLLVGTNTGDLVTFIILPSDNGGFRAEYSGYLHVGDNKIKNLIPYNTQTGASAVANVNDMAKLATGVLTLGAVIVATSTEIKIILPPKRKLSSYSVSEVTTLACGYIFTTKGAAIAVLTSASKVKILTVPELKEISSLVLPFKVDPEYGEQSGILVTGDLLIRMSKSEMAYLSVFGRGLKVSDFATDTLFDEFKLMPPRPYISAYQWAKGSKMVTEDELSLIIAGPRRPKPKYPQSDLASAMVSGQPTSTQQSSQYEDTGYKSTSHQRPRNNNAGGIGSTIQKSSQNFMRNIQDTFDDLEETTAGYANEMTEESSTAKNSIYKSILKSKFGF